MAKRTPPRQPSPRPSEPQRQQPGPGDQISAATMDRADERGTSGEYRTPQGDPEPDAIARRAYQLYCERGCGPGREMDDWLRAEYELRNRQR